MGCRILKPYTIGLPDSAALLGEDAVLVVDGEQDLKSYTIGLPDSAAHLGEEAVLVVDDDSAVRRFLRRVVERAGHRVEDFPDAEAALEHISPAKYAVALIDLNMPGHGGLWLLERLREADPDIAVVIVTGSGVVDEAVNALTHGAVDYLQKPVSTIEIKEVVGRARRNRQLELENRAYRLDLERLVQERTAGLREAMIELGAASVALERSHRESIYRLAAAAEYRDEDTGNHLVRIGLTSELLAKRVGCEEELVALIRQASPMHDVGKIGISDADLLKPGLLADEEFEEIKKHTVIGARILSGSSSKLFQLAERIALSHHEWFDGSGYPLGLRGEQIPLEGRIVAIADAFDALTSPRVYKPAYPVEKALAIIENESGTHFDPEMVQALYESLDEILEVKRSYGDPDFSSFWSANFGSELCLPFSNLIEVPGELTGIVERPN